LCHENPLQCSAVAAAIFGDAEQYVLVEMQIDERFIALQNQTVDLYLRAAPTMERDIHEVRECEFVIFFALV
jgi:ABC-type amino acid transport substrate-binding protein